MDEFAQGPGSPAAGRGTGLRPGPWCCGCGGREWWCPVTVSGVTVNVPMTPGLARLFALTDTAAAGLMRRGFTHATLDRLAAGTDATGRRLPASAHVAAARLGLNPTHRKGVYVTSRVDRLIQANVVAVLRTLADRDTALQHLTGTGCLVASHPKVRAGTAKNLGSQVARHLKRHPGAAIASLRLPMLQDTPAPGRRLILGAVDRQLRYHGTGRARHLAAPGPAPAHAWTGRPAASTGWQPRSPCPSRGTSGAGLSPSGTCPPSPSTRPSRASQGSTSRTPSRILPCATPKRRSPPVVGIDWSPVGLGVISHTRATPDGNLVSAFEGHRYDDRGLGTRLFRLQQEGEILTGKIARTGHLADGLEDSSPLRAALEAKIAVWKELRTQLGAKRSRVNRELAFHFAGWATGYAHRVGATSIAIEDLSTLTAGGIGRANNNRVAQSARRKAVDATTHLGARTGLEVIEVPARGTSAHCPGCDAELARPGGYHHARCRPCGLEGNRDQVASVNVGKRAIAGQGSLKPTARPGASTSGRLPIAQ